MANIGTNIETQLNKLTAWQYLNAANFLVSCAILIVLLF
jgi:hypothetical protein